jgi:hypothetical protein
VILELSNEKAELLRCLIFRQAVNLAVKGKKDSDEYRMLMELYDELLGIGIQHKAP